MGPTGATLVDEHDVARRVEVLEHRRQPREELGRHVPRTTGQHEHGVRIMVRRNGWHHRHPQADLSAATRGPVLRHGQDSAQGSRLRLDRLLTADGAGRHRCPRQRPSLHHPRRGRRPGAAGGGARRRRTGDGQSQHCGAERGDADPCAATCSHHAPPTLHAHPCRRRPCPTACGTDAVHPALQHGSRAPAPRRGEGPHPHPTTSGSHFCGLSPRRARRRLECVAKGGP